MEYQNSSISDIELNNNSYKGETKSLLSVQQLEHQLNLIIKRLDHTEGLDVEEEVLSDLDSDCDSFANMDRHYCEEFSDGESGKKDLEELLHDAQKIPAPFVSMDRENTSEDMKDYPLKYQTGPMGNTEQNQTTSSNPLRNTIPEEEFELDSKFNDYKNSKFYFVNFFIRFIVWTFSRILSLLPRKTYTIR